jgi:hypothetical protein
MLGPSFACRQGCQCGNTFLFLNVVWSVISANILPQLHEDQAESGANTVPLLDEVWSVISANIFPQLHRVRHLMKAGI